MNRLDWISFWNDITPEKNVAIDADTLHALTYAELNEMGNRLAWFLQSQFNFKKGSRVVVIAQNCFEYLYLFAAAQKIGSCIVPLNFRLTASEIKKLLEACEPELILYAQEFSDLVSGADNAFQLTEFFEKVIKNKEKTHFKSVEILEDDPIFILFTSGSSGLPKGVKYTHKMLFWNSVNTRISLMLHSKSKTVICMPPFHTGGWNVLLTPLLHVGGEVILMQKFEAERVLQLIEAHSCQIFMGVPTMLQMMKNHPSFENADLSSLNYIIVGGEAMPLALIQDYHQKGIPIRQGYGMTEVGPNLTSLHEELAIEKIGSIGKPNMYVEIKIVRDDGEEAGINEEGELWLSGPMVTPGYINENASNSESFEEGGWFKTGDVVQKDKDGFLYIVDRKKNMYISGGENVYPAEIERILNLHPKIHEIAVVGVPDEKWGEVGFAFVKCHSNESFHVEEMGEFCRNHLSKFKIPKHLELVNELPQSDTGKLDRKALQKHAREKVFS